MIDYSVVIAVYNGASTLESTLNCLVCQTHQNFEIILVNDESSDHSERIIRQFIAVHPELRVQYIQQKNRGLGGARNSGIRQAQGRVIALLDQDDRWTSDKLEKIHRVYTANPAVAFVTHHLLRRVNGQITEALQCRGLTGDVYGSLLFRGNYFCGSAMSFKREVVDRIGYFSEDRAKLHLAEDYDYWLRAAATGLRFHVVEEALGEYVMHESNCSANRAHMYEKEWCIVLAHYRSRPVRHWTDPLRISKRLGKVFVRKMLTRVHAS